MVGPADYFPYAQAKSIRHGGFMDFCALESSLEDAISAVVNFLTKLDSVIFKRRTWDTLEVSDAREVLSIASLVPSSFFIKTGKDQDLEDFRITLAAGFPTRWAIDLEYEFPALLSGENSQLVWFTKYWIPMWTQDSSYKLGERKSQLWRV